MINKMFLDSLDEYYSIDHNEPEPKEKPSKKNNDEKIGIISLILIVAFAIYIIGTIIHAYAYGETPEGVNPDAYIAKLKEIKQYCLDHVDRIITGGNPVKDLINAGMIRSDTFQNITCQNIDKEILWTELGKGESLKGALGID
jgi:hypothetical protein